MTKIYRKIPRMNIFKRNYTKQFEVMIEIKINGEWKEQKVLIDTGATVSHIKENIIGDLELKVTNNPIQIQDYFGNIHPMDTYVELPIRINKRNEIIINMYVEHTGKVNTELLLGTDFLEQVKPYYIKDDRMLLTIQNENLVIPRLL